MPVCKCRNRKIHTWSTIKSTRVSLQPNFSSIHMHKLNVYESASTHAHTQRPKRFDCIGFLVIMCAMTIHTSNQSTVYERWHLVAFYLAMYASHSHFEWIFCMSRITLSHIVEKVTCLFWRRWKKKPSKMFYQNIMKMMLFYGNFSPISMFICSFFGRSVFFFSLLWVHTHTNTSKFESCERKSNGWNIRDFPIFNSTSMKR